jgi:hypothetical protein
MIAQKPPQEPTNIITTDCDVVVRGIRRTVLKISPHLFKRNDEFRQSKKKRIKKNLNQYLLDDKIIKNFVQQLDGKKVRSEGINDV